MNSRPVAASTRRESGGSAYVVYFKSHGFETAVLCIPLRSHVALRGSSAAVGILVSLFAISCLSVTAKSLVDR